MKNNKKSINYKKKDISIIIMWDSYCSIMNNAYNILKKELKNKHNINNINLNLYSTRDVSNRLDDFLKDAKNSDVVFMYRTSSDDFYDNTEFNFKNLIITGQDPTYWNCGLSPKTYLYTTYGGIENFKNLILCLINSLGLNIDYNEPEKFPFQGIYYRGNIYENLDELLKNNKFDKSKNTIGILFSRHYLVNEDMEVINNLMNKLNEHFNIIPVFTYGAKDDDLNALGSGESVLKYFFKNGAPVIDALINLLSFPLRTVKDNKDNNILKKITGTDLLKKLNIPVFHPIMSYYKSYDEWKNDMQGLSQ